MFFFSSRRRHTSSLCDWSSDVCSSDLTPVKRGSSSSTGVRRGGISDEKQVSPIERDGGDPLVVPRYHLLDSIRKRRNSSYSTAKISVARTPENRNDTVHIEEPTPEETPQVEVETL